MQGSGFCELANLLLVTENVVFCGCSTQLVPQVSLELIVALKLGGKF